MIESKRTTLCPTKCSLTPLKQYLQTPAHARSLPRALLLFATGCGSSAVEKALDAPQADQTGQTLQQWVDKCNHPRNAKRTWGALAAGGGFLAASSGAATLGTIDNKDKTAAYTSAALAGFGGVLAAVASYTTNAYDEDFKELNCSEAYRRYYAERTAR